MSKQPKLFEEMKLGETEDRFSNLPNCLIGHILSFLPTKYAVRTSVLSTKWKKMWTLISNLDFDDQLLTLHPPTNNSDQCKASFMKFVYRVLLLLETSNVNKFRIRSCANFDVSYDVNSWVSASLSRSVREIDLYLYIPLKGFDSSKRLFSGCPKLEDLALRGCQWQNMSVLDISAPALNRLTIIDCETNTTSYTEFYEYRIELNTPSLLYLNYVDYVVGGYAMGKLNSLAQANIGFATSIDSFEEYYEIYYKSTTELAQRIANVHTLHLSNESIQGLLHCDHSQEFVDDWVPPNCVPSCLVFHLKIVDIREFEGHEYEQKIVKYFLCNAKVRLLMAKEEKLEMQLVLGIFRRFDEGTNQHNSITVLVHNGYKVG
ncbi:unnamed protein product [Ilex paraguariensis]|uniref:F-box domain-containing protein n=1 Tax=Ilex paraguariensis TaxID=185542 RepID=A0ABC8QZX8_9AQUA